MKNKYIPWLRMGTYMFIMTILNSCDSSPDSMQGDLHVLKIQNPLPTQRESNQVTLTEMNRLNLMQNPDSAFCQQYRSIWYQNYLYREAAQYLEKNHPIINIRINHAVPQVYHKHIKAAAAEWNRLLLKIEFRVSVAESSFDTEQGAHINVVYENLGQDNAWARAHYLVLLGHRDCPVDTPSSQTKCVGRFLIYDSAQIIINSNHSSPEKCPDTFGCSFVQDTILHELGHSLGLDHIKDRCDSIMSTEQWWCKDTAYPTAFDRQLIACAYQTKSSTPRAPASISHPKLNNRNFPFTPPFRCELPMILNN